MHSHIYTAPQCLTEVGHSTPEWLLACEAKVRTLYDNICFKGQSVPSSQQSP